MNDLISRNALIEKMNDTSVEIMFDLPVEELLGEEVDMDDFCTLLQDAIQAYRKLIIEDVIKKAPPVEAVPVVRGEWIDTQPEYHHGYRNNAHKCSNCNDYYTTEYDDLYFCPRCGSRMKEWVKR